MQARPFKCFQSAMSPKRSADVEESCAGRPSFLDGVCDDGLRMLATATSSVLRRLRSIRGRP